MKLKIIMICLLLCGCSFDSDPSERHIEEYLESYCSEKDKQYKDQKIVFEKEIVGVGYYVIARATSQYGDILISIRQDFDTQKKPDGFNETGPAFDGKPYRIYKNEDKSYGHGKNYYLCVVKGDVLEASYKGSDLDIDIVNYSLNGEKSSISSWLIVLDKTEEINMNLLKYRLK